MTRKRRQRGFILIWGSRQIEGYGSGQITGVCPSCKNNSVFQLRIIQEWFTLYYIPLAPTRVIAQYVQCATCRAPFRLNLQQMQDYLNLESRKPALVQRVRALKVTLEQQPDNAQVLAETMVILLELGDAKEIVSMAFEFQAALNSSDQCMTQLAQALLKENDFEMAETWAKAAIRRNPENAEAQHLLQNLKAIQPGPLPD